MDTDEGDPLPTLTGAARTATAPELGATQTAWAYSTEQVADEPPAQGVPSRWPWWMAAGIAGLIVTLGAVIAVLVWLVGQPAQQALAPPPVTATPQIITVTQPPPSTVVKTTVVTTMAPPPPGPPAATATNTVDAAPPPGVATPNYDAQFIANMKSIGWLVTDPVAMASTGRQVCAMLAGGATPDQVSRQLAASNGNDMTEATQFVGTAVMTYPNCS